MILPVPNGGAGEEAYARLYNAKKIKVGTRQTIKTIEREEAKVVFIAQDAEPHVTAPVLELCAQKNVPVLKVESMEALGRACKIEVGAAAAAIIEE